MERNRTYKILLGIILHVSFSGDILTREKAGENDLHIQYIV